MPVKRYKILVYICLIVVVAISFAITNLLLTLIISEKIGVYSVIFIILNLIVNFTMFFIVFRFSQMLIEKDSALQEILGRIQASKEIMEETIEPEKEKGIDADAIVQQIISNSSQNANLEKFTESILANIAKVSELVQGVVYVKNTESGEFRGVGKYAYYSGKPAPVFTEGETLPGQVAKDKKMLNIVDIPGDYFTITSGLGSGKPNNLLIFPVVDKDNTIAVIELATFKPYSKDFEKVFEKLAVLLAKMINKVNKGQRE